MTDDQPPRVPRWVKVTAIVIGALIVVLVALQLAGIGPGHGPGLHRAVAGLAGPA